MFGMCDFFKIFHEIFVVLQYFEFVALHVIKYQKRVHDIIIKEASKLSLNLFRSQVNYFTSFQIFFYAD